MTHALHDDKLNNLLHASRTFVELNVIDDDTVASIPELGSGYFIADGTTITEALIGLNTIVAAFMEEHPDWQKQFTGYVAGKDNTL